MNDQEKELLYDLLVKQVTEGLTADERKQLDGFDPELVRVESRAIETTVAAINMAAIEIDPMPQELLARVAKAAPAAFGEKAADWDGGDTIPAMQHIVTADELFGRKPRTFIFGLLGWIAAAILLIVVGVQFFSGRLSKQQPEKAIVGYPTPSAPAVPNIAEQRDEFVRTAPDVISAMFAPGNMKELQVAGDVVWSDEKQQGFVRLRGLPQNDTASTSYQLWIFDKTQDAATPIDGGVFNISSTGEVIVPIHASLHAVKPQMFAVTVEKAGGVMVSKRERIAALAKVETQNS